MKFNIYAIALLLLFSVVYSPTVQAQCDITCEECELPLGTVIGDAFLTGFNNNASLAYADANAMGLLAGANNAFAGTIWTVNPMVADFSTTNLCLSGTFQVTASDPSVYPITIEYRIENNNCGAAPCPQTSFDLVVNADGSISTQGFLAGGTPGPGGPFDPNGPNPAIVAAIANFSGTPMQADVNISFTSNSITEFSCVDHPAPPPECIDVGTGGGTDGGQGGVPTMGEWGIICLSILFLTLGLVFLRSKVPALQTD